MIDIVNACFWHSSVVRFFPYFLATLTESLGMFSYFLATLTESVGINWKDIFQEMLFEQTVFMESDHNPFDLRMCRIDNICTTPAIEGGNICFMDEGYKDN